MKKTFAKAFGDGMDKILSNKNMRSFIILIFTIDLVTTVLGGVLGVILYLLGAMLVVTYIGDPKFFSKKNHGEKENEKNNQ